MKERPIICVIDLDGTLLDDNKQISRENHNAIVSLKNRGGIVIIATARPPRSAITFAQQLGISLPVITYNGALITDADSRSVLFHFPLSDDMAMEMINLAKSLLPDLFIHLEVKDQCYFNKTIPTDLHLATLKEGFPPDYIGTLDKSHFKEVSKLLFLQEESKLRLLLPVFYEQYATRVNLQINETFCLQITDRQATKENALDTLIRYLNINKSFIVAIGDGLNDTGLLKMADLSIAMGNAPDELKQQSHWIAPTNNENGVAYAIEHWVLARLVNRKISG